MSPKGLKWTEPKQSLHPPGRTGPDHDEDPQTPKTLHPGSLFRRGVVTPHLCELTGALPTPPTLDDPNPGGSEPDAESGYRPGTTTLTVRERPRNQYAREVLRGPRDPPLPLRPETTRQREDICLPST